MCAANYFLGVMKNFVTGQLRKECVGAISNSSFMRAAARYVLDTYPQWLKSGSSASQVSGGMQKEAGRLVNHGSVVKVVAEGVRARLKKYARNSTPPKTRFK